MKDLAIAAALAAAFLPAHAEYQLRIIDGDHAYYDTESNLTWVDGVRAYRDLPWDDPTNWYNPPPVYTGIPVSVSSVAQLTVLNHEIQKGTTFEHIFDLGPFYTHVNYAYTGVWTNEIVYCRLNGMQTGSRCTEVEPGEPYDFTSNIVYAFGPGDGFAYPYPDDFPLKLSLRMYVGDVGISPVPEPETYALMLAGLGAIGLIRRRRVQG